MLRSETIINICFNFLYNIQYLTLSFTGLAYGVHLITRVTFTLEIPLQVDADLTAGIRVLTLIDICGVNKHRHENSLNTG